jgi:hypothetical protein
MHTRVGMQTGGRRKVASEENEPRFNGWVRGTPRPKADECIGRGTGSVFSSPRFGSNTTPPFEQTPMQCRCGWSQLSSPTTPFFYTTRKTAVDELATGQSTLLAASTGSGEDASRNFCSVHPDGHQPEAMTRQPTAESEAAITPSAPVQLQAQYHRVRIVHFSRASLFWSWQRRARSQNVSRMFRIPFRWQFESCASLFV